MNPQKKTQQQAPIEVLIVDDDPDILALLQDTLCLENDFMTTATKDPLEALEFARHKMFDLIISDLMMPETDGITFSCAIKEISPETLVIIITGYPTLESAIEAIRHGVYEYLQKPFSLEQFKLVLNKAISHITVKRENKAMRQEITKLQQEVARLKNR